MKDYKVKVFDAHFNTTNVIVTAKSKDEAVRRLKACKVREVISIEELSKRQKPKIYPKKDDVNYRSVVGNTYSIPKPSSKKSYK